MSIVSCSNSSDVSCSSVCFRCQAISATIKEVEASSAQGLVLASSAPTILSAGLDLTELHNPDTERLPKFWKSFQQLFVDLYGSPLATVAAIEGHAPAGGCMLSMASDYRIMGAGEGKNIPRIGLNETQFGIVAPPWMAELLLLTVGHREGEKALSLGTLYSPDEALNIGLVDEVVPSEEVLARAQAEAAKWAKIPSMARAASKSIPRQPLLEKLIKTAEADTKQFVAFTTNDAVQQHLGRYLESLQRKK